MYPARNIILGLWSMSLAFSPKAFADQEQPRVTVQGTCFRQVKQDKGFVEFLIEFTEKDGKTAVAKVEAQQKDLKKAIEALTLKAIEFETLSFNVYPQYEYVKNTTKLLGHRAGLTLRVETSETPRVGDLAAVGPNVGLKAVQNTGFFISSQKLSEEKSACLEEAVLDARKRADRLAKAAGLKIKRAFNIVQSEIPRNQGFEVYAKSTVMDAGAAHAPQLDQKSQEIHVMVTATFEAL